MPKVTDSHKFARRRQILDGARACFARQGYQATTVRDLETATRLSSGAIFNYFNTKADIFLALAEEDTEQLAMLWSHGGLRAVIEGHADTDASYRASFMEVGRELLTDTAFRERWEQRGETLYGAIREWLTRQLEQGLLRTDLSLEDLITYSVIHLDGINLQLRLGANPSNLTVAVDLYEKALQPPLGRRLKPTPASVLNISDPLAGQQSVGSHRFRPAS